MKLFPLEKVCIVSRYFLLFLSTLVGLPLIKILSPSGTFMPHIKNYIYVSVLLLLSQVLNFMCVNLCNL